METKQIHFTKNQIVLFASKMTNVTSEIFSEFSRNIYDSEGILVYNRNTTNKYIMGAMPSFGNSYSIQNENNPGAGKVDSLVGYFGTTKGLKIKLLSNKNENPNDKMNTMILHAGTAPFVAIFNVGSNTIYGKQIVDYFAASIKLGINYGNLNQKNEFTFEELIAGHQKAIDENSSSKILSFIIIFIIVLLIGILIYCIILAIYHSRSGRLSQTLNKNRIETPIRIRPESKTAGLLSKLDDIENSDAYSSGVVDKM